MYFMTQIKRLTKNVALLFISQVISNLVAFFYTIITARYLGVENFGVLTFALAFTGIFAIFTDLGLRQLSVREISRSKTLANKYMTNITIIKIILSSLTFIFIYTLSYILGYSEITINVILLITIYMIFNAYSQTIYSVFQAYEKMGYQSLSIVLNNILLFLGSLFVISQGKDLIYFAEVYLVVSVILVFINIILLSKMFFKMSAKIDFEFWKFLFSNGLPFAITGISIYLYTYLDTIMLSIYKGDEAVGLYGAAYKIVLTLLIIPIILNTSIFPLMSQFFISSKKTLALSFEKYLKIMILLALPLTLLISYLSGEIINIIYGYQYTDSIIILQILIWSLFFMFLRSPYERLFESINKPSIATKIFIIGLIFNIALNIIVIPIYSYIGAGIATVATDIIILILLIYISRKIGYNLSRKSLIDFTKIIFSSILFILTFEFLYFLNVFLSCFISLIVFMISLFILKVFDKREKEIMKSIIGLSNK